MRVLLVAFLSLVSCGPSSPDSILDSTEYGPNVCESVECSAGFSCEPRFGVGVCIPNRLPSGYCDLRCPSGQECRFEICVSPDPSGLVCEFDDFCKPDEVCVIDRCTSVACRPGDSIPCYSGPSGTNGIGECKGGFHLCTQDLYFTKECIDEVTPYEEVGVLACNGLDDDCDGVSDVGDLGPVDIVFAFDTSGSMREEFDAVTAAIPLASAMYNHPSVRLGLIFFPGGEGGYSERWKPFTVIPLVEYSVFEMILGLVLRAGDSGGSSEASWDVPVLLATGQQEDMSFREEATPVVIMFTDEAGQSYMTPEQNEQSMCSVVESSEMELFVVTTNEFSSDFDDCSTIVPLEENPENVDRMVDSLSSIVDSVCWN